MNNSKVTQIYGLNPEELTQQLLNALKGVLATSLQPVLEETEDELLTREEASNYLKVSKATLNNWSNLGVVKKHKIGNMVRYKKSELQNALIG